MLAGEPEQYLPFILIMALAYTFLEQNRREIRKFNVQGIDYSLTIDSVPDGTDYIEAIVMVHSVITSMYKQTTHVPYFIFHFACTFFYYFIIFFLKHV